MILLVRRRLVFVHDSQTFFLKTPCIHPPADTIILSQSHRLYSLSCASSGALALAACVTNDGL